MKYYLFLFYYLISSPALSQNIEDHLKLLGLPLEPSIEMCLTPDKPNCSELTDSFCKELWKSENNGNLRTPTGDVSYGNSPKSETSLAKIKDLKAFVESQSRLPTELQENPSYIDLVQKLRKHLEAENSSSEWGNELAIINFQISNQHYKIAKEIVYSKNPELRNKPEKAYTLIESRLFEQANHDLNTKIINAKYKHSEGWAKAEKIYFEVKANLVQIIQSTSLPAVEKNKMIEKVQSVELSLPYTDPKLLGADVDCSKDTINAYYSPNHNKLTLCAGELNADAEGALAFTIGHELSHSFDLSNQAYDTFQKTPIVQGIKTLLKQEGQIKDCSFWNKLISDKIFEPARITNMQIGSPFNHFKNCLIDKSSLDPFTEEKVLPVIQQFARNNVDFYATSNGLALSLTPQLTKNDQKVTNDFYLNPKNSYELTGRGYLFDLPAIPIFQYSMACKPGQNQPIDVSSIPDAEKEQAFDTATEQTTKFSEAFNRLQLSICGDECRALNDKNLAKTTGENFADWFGSRATAMYMKSLPAEKKKSAAKEMVAFLCNKPEASYDQVYTSAQKKHSSEEHEDNRIRRLSLFSEEVATQAGCELDQAVSKGFNLCKL